MYHSHDEAKNQQILFLLKVTDTVLSIKNNDALASKSYLTTKSSSAEKISDHKTVFFNFCFCSEVCRYHIMFTFKYH